VTSKDVFSEEEWVRIRRAPLVAGMAISIADPGGPIEMTKETMASLKAASSPPSNEELLIAVSQDIMAMGQQKQNPIGGFKVQNAALAGKEILDELSAANDIVTAKATPDEATGYRRWLVAVAQAAADSAKEGGFMGFGAEQVSQGERTMIDQLEATLGV
jgi:hypothetical protein